MKTCLTKKFLNVITTMLSLEFDYKFVCAYTYACVFLISQIENLTYFNRVERYPKYRLIA